MPAAQQTRRPHRSSTTSAQKSSTSTSWQVQNIIRPRSPGFANQRSGTARRSMADAGKIFGSCLSSRCTYWMQVWGDRCRVPVPSPQRRSKRPDSVGGLTLNSCPRASPASTSTCLDDHRKRGHPTALWAAWPPPGLRGNRNSGTSKFDRQHPAYSAPSRVSYNGPSRS